MKPFTTEMERKKCSGCFEPDYLNHNSLCQRCQRKEHLQNLADNISELVPSSIDKENTLILKMVIDSAKLVRSDDR